MRFEILGPVRIRVDEAEVPLPAGRERAVLALLLVHANHVVAVDRLIDAVWGEDPPPTARGQLQHCISRLRRTLLEHSTEEIIATDPAGYRLRVEDEDVDAVAFARLVAEARAAVAEERLADAREQFRSALRLWRGPALAGLTTGALQAAAAGLDEQRLAAIEDRVEVDLRLGGEPGLVAELTALVEEYPLRERLRGQLMLALYRSGRQAEALAVYRRGSAVLAEELGLEPGAGLRDLHQRILIGDPSLSWTPPEVDHSDPVTVGLARDDFADAARPAPVVTPVRALPRDVADFTGRTAIVARLLNAEPSGAAPLIHVIDGMAGTGKTALALHVAHRLADRYPDAQLYIDLHGHSEEAPVEPAAALDTLLRQIGLPGERIPETLDERAALWRTELAARRALVVLDNAASTAQVSPLLPADPGSLAMVTSRRRLVGLDGVRPLALDPAAPGEAVDMLARMAGPRVWQEPEAAAEVARLCGYLPLALRLAGARLAHRPQWSVAALAARLRAAPVLLAELAVEGRTLAAAFALSYEQLADRDKRVFRLLGLQSGVDFDEYAVAALAGLTLAEAGEALENLLDLHLVEAPGIDRYRLHDLLRDYARGLVLATDAEADRNAAQERLLSFYLYGTSAASASLEVSFWRLPLVGEPPRHLPEFTAAPAGLGWLEAERRNLVASVRHAAEAGFDRYACALAGRVWRFLYIRGYNDDLIETHQQALVCADRQGDLEQQAYLHNYLASAYYRLGRWPEAAAGLEIALRLAQAAGTREGEATILGNLSLINNRLGRLREALVAGERSLAVWRELETPAPNAQGRLVSMYTKLGRYEEAARLNRENLDLTRDHRLERAAALSDLGVLESRRGHLDEALCALREALEMQVACGNRYGHAEVLVELARVYRLRGETDRAHDALDEAIPLMNTVADASGICMARNELGNLMRATGRPAAALRAYREALELAARVQERYEEAMALYGLSLLEAETDPDQSRRHRDRSLEILTELGVPEQDEVAKAVSWGGERFSG